ncbi:DUF2807 domain-containing protein [Pacificimonas sp. WHA3]|uniref:DUF2807 domain-containing protein n=1 Tax=Pacificimonas pallii TaxID=2827236 RepID=A0ABS6SD92_9SPHN|nr:head GIN domain-containing protein [Pacificimonas pallii]MBV7256388.1 DUF2807 domain-containing protein [Pacificimonas pallii]
MLRPFLFTAASSTLMLMSCAPVHAAEKSWMVGNFEKIEVGGAFNVEIVTGSAQGVTASGPQEEIDRLVVEVNGRTLELGNRKSDKWFDWSSSKGRLNITVTVPRLSSARLGGSGDVNVDNMVGDEVSLAVSGAGDLSVGNVTAETLNIAVSGSGDIGAAGRCRDGSYRISGSGSIEAEELTCTTLDARIAGSGDILASASRTAKGSVAGSGDISVSGGAKCESEIKGSGTVTCD